MINVNAVYQTVLLILNKEQRGYVTPNEFNKIATQVQLDIFEKYFEDLNQQIRVPQNNSQYGNRLDNLDEKTAIFKDNIALNHVNLYPSRSFWTLPSSVHFIGDLKWINELKGKEYIIERVNPGEASLRENSNYTSPNTIHPIYTETGAYTAGSSIAGANVIRVFGPPADLLSANAVRADIIRKPRDVVWAYQLGSMGQYLYEPTTTGAGVIPQTGSQDFELHMSEQTEIVLNILMYMGVVIRDPQIVQNAAQMIQQDEVNAKS